MNEWRNVLVLLMFLLFWLVAFGVGVAVGRGWLPWWVVLR